MKRREWERERKVEAELTSTCDELDDLGDLKGDDEKLEDHLHNDLASQVPRKPEYILNYS